MRFIPKQQVPEDRMKDVTYGKFVCNVRPEKDEVNRTRFVVGGNRINYPGDIGTPTADMLLAKILFNSVISTKNARFMLGDIKNFYLNTPLKKKEYTKLKLADIPQEVINEYKLKDMSTKDDSVYLGVVWSAKGWTTGPRVTTRKIGTTMILPEQNHPRIVEA